ncbi:hypothetical protein [Novosphingobium gossypii]|uniref:hypothetical protein n=1 Tax=Novosphingobium gossypii TaxID=1604774 RepID=UPI003D225CC4
MMPPAWAFPADLASVAVIRSQSDGNSPLHPVKTTANDFPQDSRDFKGKAGTFSCLVVNQAPKMHVNLQGAERRS